MDRTVFVSLKQHIQQLIQEAVIDKTDPKDAKMLHVLHNMNRTCDKILEETEEE